MPTSRTRTYPDNLLGGRDFVVGDVHGCFRIRNMRDVRRFAMAIQETVGVLEAQVAQVDVLALEAIRVFLPEIFRLLPGAIDGLTVTSRPLERELDRMMPQDFADSSSAFNERCKARVNGLLEATKKYGGREADPTAEEVVKSMLDCLFPAGAQLRQMSDDGSEPHANHDVAKHLTERPRRSRARPSIVPGGRRQPELAGIS